MVILTAKNLAKSFREGENTLTVLNDLNLEVAVGKKIGIVGASGVGKSTLLHILGGLDRPTAGSVFLEENHLYQLSEKERARTRNRRLGFVFQFYHLLPELSALENVMLPCLIAGFAKKEAANKAALALEEVGLGERERHSPLKLSGGEQQRVALARACVMRPKLILADEPTGNLDEQTGREVLQFLFKAVEQAEGSLILVTHNREMLKNCDEVYELKNGTLHKIA